MNTERKMSSSEFAPMQFCNDDAEVTFIDQPSSTPQHPYYPSRPHTPSHNPSSPPNSPPPFMTGSVVSTVSDADEAPLTPNSKHSGSVFNVVNTYAGGGSPAPSCFSVKEHNNTSDSTHPAPTLEDRRLLDGLIGRSVDDQDPSETISEKAKDGYARLTENLSANAFRYMLYYLEAVRERKRMCYFASCWEVAETERREALVLCMREESKVDFMNAERDSRNLLDIFSRRLSLPSYDSGPDVTDVIGVRNSGRRSLRRTDAQLAILKNRANHDAVDGMQVTDN